MSWIKVDLPDPETPVTQINLFRGKVTLIFLRFHWLALVMVIWWLGFWETKLGRDSIFNLPDKYFPVKEFLLFSMSFKEPWATISPPFFPAYRPKSTIWSAFLITSSSCSTTTTVLPKSLNFFRVPMFFYSTFPGCFLQWLYIAAKS